MKKLFQSILFLFIFSLIASVNASETTRQEYLELIKLKPHLISILGDFSKGEIQIVLDPLEMAAIEKATGRDVGVIKQDKYWIWINDACIFPSGHKGVYGRILMTQALDSNGGVAVMPIMPDGRIALNCNFRHATRTWEIELPRGIRDVNETIESAAKRETMEETGMLVEELTLLGQMPPDSGLTSTVVPIFAAKVHGKQNPQQEEAEAIEEIILLSLQEIKEAFLCGYYTCNIRGTEKKVLFRDPFLAYAILLYELQQSKKIVSILSHYIEDHFVDSNEMVDRYLSAWFLFLPWQC